MKESYKKEFAKGCFFLFLLTSLSPVYAGFAFSDSESTKSKIVETRMVDIRNPLDEESFLDRYKSSETDKHYHKHHYFNHHRNYPLRKTTVIDGVDGSWDIVVPDDYPTIQKAINNADQGYRILVRTGTYRENVEIDVQSLTLRGEDKDATIIDRCGTGHVIMIASGGDGVNISGFTIKNSGDDNAGLNITSHYNIIQDNIIIDNSAGISLYLSSGNQIRGNLITDNAADGLWLRYSNGNNIIDNTIMKNGDNGIELSYFSLGTTIEDNTISDNNICGILLT